MLDIIYEYDPTFRLNKIKSDLTNELYFISWNRNLKLISTKLSSTDRSSKHRITAAHLSMNESEKKRSALVVELISYRNADNKIKLTSLSTDGSSSKKAAISFK